MKRNIYKILLTVTICTFGAVHSDTLSAQIASGGAFSLEKSVIATGGSESANGAFSLVGTSGQNHAGLGKGNLYFLEKSGFWTPEMLQPTAATVSVSGQVKTAFGNGIRNVVLTIVNSRGESRMTVTGSLGYYRFTDIEVGDTYIITVSAKKFEFNNSVQFVLVNNEMSDIDFIADN